MHRQPLLAKLAAYTPSDSDELRMYNALVEFVASNPACFERSLSAGHVTGSAWIVDRSVTHALLTHHRKLDRWLQPGGHADGDTDILAVALREAREESGLKQLSPWSDQIYDVDVHLIPARGTEPAHWHYDVRFLLKASGEEPLIVSNESRDLAWVTMNEVPRFSADPSILRMLNKLSGFT